MTNDERFMRRALDLALRGWGQVAPNPLVGAVVVSADGVVGEGFHARYGTEHAERVALAAAGAGARGATLYVTLEPCGHHGQTPPCTDAIVESGVSRVVFACRDPDPMAGGGAESLRAAGIDTHEGVCALEAVRLNAPFFWRRVGHGPWVALKMALSLDGRISEGDGLRTDITGPEAGEYVHRLRAGHDAILIGGRTAAVDDPLLTIRLAERPRIPPMRVVLDPGLDLPVSARLLETIEESPLLIFCTVSAPQSRRRGLEARGAEVVSVEADERGLDLAEVMGVLESRGVESVLAEGGGLLAASLIGGGYVRRQHLIYAPILLGPSGVPMIGALLADEGDWGVAERRALGEDTALVIDDRIARQTMLEAA